MERKAPCNYVDDSVDDPEQWCILKESRKSSIKLLELAIPPTAPVVLMMVEGPMSPLADCQRNRARSWGPLSKSTGSKIHVLKVI